MSYNFDDTYDQRSYLKKLKVFVKEKKLNCLL